MGLVPYLLTWMMFPVFQLLLIAFIYREDRALLAYVVIAGFGNALIIAMLFNAGEILDTERRRGTFGNLFLAPCSRYVWLAGFQLFALIEALVMGVISVGLGVLFFGVALSINVVSLIATLALFACSLWGISMALGAIGVLARGANLISNLALPIVTLVAGTTYPIALMPDWIRIPARALPFSYGTGALVDAITKHASLAGLRPELLPLAGFAIVLPVLGVLAFQAVERSVRRLGYLEIS